MVQQNSLYYTATALKDIDKFKKSGNKILQSRNQRLIAQIEVAPFTGIGKPHALTGELSGCFSVKINDQHRIVYEVSDTVIFIHSLWGHYSEK